MGVPFEKPTTTTNKNLTKKMLSHSSQINYLNAVFLVADFLLFTKKK
jgi:hypothetical protein